MLGIIEGFYGKPWSWEARKNYAYFIKDIDFNFYIYAPKEDKYLRENWNLPLPKETFEKLKELSGIYHGLGLKWGIGLSLFNAYLSFDNTVKTNIKKKLNELSLLKPDVIAILFDDMKGDINNIAETQVSITHFVLENSDFAKIIFCPTYYTFDPILESVFGKKPKNYLHYIGDNLDSKIDIIWTGPMVRSEYITVEHLKEVQDILKRKPFIWDNYIANDGKEHEQFLYIKPFKNRNTEILDYISGFMINPMNQAYLSQIPIQTFADELKLSNHYTPSSSIKNAVEKVCGRKHKEKVIEYTKDFLKGRESISEKRREEIYRYCSSIDEQWSIEIVEWLKG